MKMYRAKWATNSVALIDTVDVNRVTKDAVYITYSFNGVHREYSYPLKSQFEAFFDTWEEAHTYLLDHVNKCAQGAYKQVGHWLGVLNRVRKLTKEDSENDTK